MNSMIVEIKSQTFLWCLATKIISQNKFWYFHSPPIDIDIPQIYPIVQQNVTHFTKYKHDREAQPLE